VQRSLLLEYARTGRPAARLASLAIALAVWPWRSGVLAWKMTRVYGKNTKCIRKPSIQFVQQIYFAWIHGISPTMYYQMGMAASTRLSPSFWIQSGHAALLSRIFRKDKALAEINDKFIFFKLLRGSGINVIPVLAAYDSGLPKTIPGQAKFAFDESEVDEIFIKPCRSSRGAGSSIWRRTPSGRWLKKLDGQAHHTVSRLTDAGDPVDLSSENLDALLAKHSVSRSLIVQPRIRNHPDISRVFGNALLSIRVLSGIAGGEVRVLRTVIYAPALDSITSQNGFIVEIDRDTGRLGSVFSHGPDPSLGVKHPQTGIVIDGTRIPCWADVLVEVRRAHQALSDFAFLGWDVAVSLEGPIIIEANGNFETHSLQRAGPKPLIDDDFLFIFESWKQNSVGQGGEVR